MSHCIKSCVWLWYALVVQSKHNSDCATWAPALHYECKECGRSFYSNLYYGNRISKLKKSEPSRIFFIQAEFTKQEQWEQEWDFNKWLQNIHICIADPFKIYVCLKENMTSKSFLKAQLFESKYQFPLSSWQSEVGTFKQNFTYLG